MNPDTAPTVGLLLQHTPLEDRLLHAINAWNNQDPNNKRSRTAVAESWEVDRRVLKKRYESHHSRQENSSYNKLLTEAEELSLHT